MIRPCGQEVKTSPFHGGNTGSIPVGVILVEYNTRRVRLANASLVARIGAQGASIPVGVILRVILILF